MIGLKVKMWAAYVFRYLTVNEKQKLLNLHRCKTVAASRGERSKN